MNCRKLGKTSLNVSEIGLGCEGFISKNEAFTKEMFETAFVKMIDLFIKNGFNYFDTAHGYM